MKRSYSIFSVPFISAFVIACSAVTTGCTASTDPEATTDSAEEALINESGPMSVPAQGEVRIERAGEAFSLVPGAALKETAPGVWESEGDDGASRIVVGVEGHQWAIEQAEKDLADLVDRSAQRADSDPDSVLMDAIQQSEAHLKNLKDAAQGIAAAQGTTPQAVSCNIGFYTGPSSPVVGTYGAAALTQVACSGGCQVFTISAQACTNFGCSPVASSSSWVCSSPWTFGVSKGGTYGASCSSATSISPPGITSSWSGYCG
jgi:hypothetical protein